MQHTDGHLLLSASDLVAFLECEHLSALDLRVAQGSETIERTRTDSTDLVARKGDEHEQAFLDSLIRQGLDVAVIPSVIDGLVSDAEAVEQTISAMRAGVDVIYQAALADGSWRGFADFLEKVPMPCPALGGYSYEVLDTKLARHAKPGYLVQLCLYSDLLASVQGISPAQMHVILGSQERESFRLDEFSAFYRRLRRRYETRLTDGFAGTYPDPVEHCGLCRWSEHCSARREADDHLSLVAGLGRAQAIRLSDTGITTWTQLAVVQPEDRPARIGRATFERLRQQARLQLHERSTGEPTYELLRPQEGRGFARLPEPRPGDLFFDMEGDPFYEGDGLEYLFGVTRIEDGDPVFRSFWAHDRREEKVAFGAFVDFVLAALAEDPALHVYHYAPYEPSALKRLMGRHGTREEEIDRLLREKVLVDLYAVTVQAMRTSKPGYSIKQIEEFYMPQRDQDVTDAGDSIVRFEEWLDTGEPGILDAIETYNEVDCLSTVELHRWLLDRRTEAQEKFAVAIPWRSASEPHEASPEATAVLDEIVRIEAALVRNMPEDHSKGSEEQRARWLMAHLLHYHRREEKPVWWAYFNRLEMSQEELVEDAEAIGELTEDPVELPIIDKRSLIHTLRFREQEHKLAPGAEIRDVETQRQVDVVDVDTPNGLLRIRRGQSRAHEPLPQGLVPGGPYRSDEQRAALRRLGAVIAASGVDGPGEFRALRDLLRRAPPRISGRVTGESLQDGSPHIDDLKRIAEGLDSSYLFIQGPPG